MTALLGQDRYLLAGEFHYFRVPAGQWRQRLDKVAEAGLSAVSIYVPWNWHEPRPGALDFTGQTSPEKNLIQALDTIAAAGLDCIFRPGPFITAEWRGGGMPAWLWEQHPEILALRADGSPTGIDPYPAITYAAPAYRDACRQWYSDVLSTVAGHRADRGGPIINIQLDDEPSYWLRLLELQPDLLDYNPVLVAPDGDGPSAYGRWLLDRYGDLPGVDAAHATTSKTPADLAPPTSGPTERSELQRQLDWMDFKLTCIDDYVAFLYHCAREHDDSTPISLLFPYFLPLSASRFRSRSPGRELPLQLTNEVYLSLFGPASCREQKVAAIVSTHEAFHMWRGPEPAVTIEVQGSNASYITPGAMELLYAVSVARGIRGLCFYMMVGGDNPPGYELGTGSNYDVSAPITRTGGTRPHYTTIQKLSRIVAAADSEIRAAEPVRDIAFGWWVPYEMAALMGLGSAFADITEAMRTTFSTGEIGTGEALTLQTLMTDASVSFGYLDLEQCSDDALAAVRQLWVPALEQLPARVQERLAAYVRAGGDLVLTPHVPAVDERGAACDVLTRLVFGAEDPPDYAAPVPFAEDLARVVTATGDLLLALQPVSALPVPAGAEVLATLDTAPRPDSQAEDTEGSPACAIRVRAGAGRVTVLGFRLQYVPTESAEHRDFLLALLPGSPATSAEPAPVTAMQLRGPAGGLLCLVNPVEVPALARARYTRADGSSGALPAVLDGIDLDRQGARLLPIDLLLGPAAVLRSATWELVGRTLLDTGAVELRFATAGDARGEVVLSGPARDCSVDGGALAPGQRVGDDTAYLITAAAPEVALTVPLST
ncbi:MAG: beta-galactosidase [Actinomycetota bacterium]|nr:beta-galactosidase [Actinomycetota bacterium]